jgi:hypothetical protein
MRLLYYCIVGDPLYTGCIGETHFPQQTPSGRHPSHIQLITRLFLNTIDVLPDAHWFFESQTQLTLTKLIDIFYLDL